MIKGFVLSKGDEGFVGDITISKGNEHFIISEDPFLRTGDISYASSIGFVDQDGDVGSPTVGLVHELADFHLGLTTEISNAPNWEDPNLAEDLFFGSIGERIVIEEWETPIAQSMGLSTNRKADGIGNISLEIKGGVNSTKPKNTLQKAAAVRTWAITRSVESMKALRKRQKD